MKRLGMILILAILLIALSVTVSAAEISGTCGENLVWEFDAASGTLTISGTGPMDDWKGIAHPGWEDLGSQDSGLIKHIVIEEGVTRIGTEAFYGCSAKTVSLPSSLTHIGANAFRYAKIQEIDFPDNIICIENEAFLSCDNISELQLPKGLEVLGYSAFDNMDRLEKVKIGPNLKDFSLGVFNSCPNLSLIEFTSDAPVFNSAAFMGVDATVVYPAGNNTWTESVRQQYDGTVYWHPSDGLNASGTFDKGNKPWVWALENGTLTISGEGDIRGWTIYEKAPWHSFRGVIKKVVMEGTFTNVPSDAFLHCSNLESVVFPDGLLIIYDGAFAGCTSLETMVLPDTVFNVGDKAFQGCLNLKKITMPKDLEYISQWSFDGCRSLEEMYFSGDIPRIFGNVTTNCVLFVYYPAGNSTWSEANITEFKKGFPSNAEFVGVEEPFDPLEPMPTEPMPTEPVPTEPKPTEPKPTELKPTEPKPTEPMPTEPKPTEPMPTEPKPTEPKPTEPAVTTPPETVPDVTYPVTEPQETQPQGTEGTDPTVAPTEPAVQVTKPESKTPWTAIVIAGVLVLACGAAAVWVFVIKKRT